MKPIIITPKENKKMDLEPGELKTASLEELLAYRNLLLTAVNYIEFRIAMKQEFKGGKS